MQVYLFNQNLVKNLFWSTICLKTQSKVVIDPQNLQESSLSNNLVMTTGFAPIGALQNISVSIEKGQNILRTNYVGA
jgi:hypothetical protein